MDKIVEIVGLNKYYRRSSNFLSRDKIQALDALNLTIHKGDIFAILGPNGAGKTTILNIICGLSSPSCGEVKVFGKTFEGQERDIKCRIGYLPEEDVLPDCLSVRELLQFLADIFGLNSHRKRKRIDGLIEKFELEGLLKKRIQLLSSGQKRILGFACALINDPELLILDEPTVYLDPFAVKRFTETIINFKQTGKTVIISSHILSQIERLCERILILKAGRMKFVGKNRDLLKTGSLEEVFTQLTS